MEASDLDNSEGLAEATLELLANLRQSVSNLHESIGVSFATRGEFWDTFKGNLMSLEARVATFEVRLSGITDEQWRDLQSEGVIAEIEQISRDVREMRSEVNKILSEVPQ